MSLEVIKQALEALDKIEFYSDGGLRNYPDEKEADGAITALRQALEQSTVKESLMVDPTCKQSLQVQCWVIPSSKQFSWDQQDERFWVRMGPVKQQPAVSVKRTNDEPVAWMWRCKPYCDWPNWAVSLKRPADSGRDGYKRTEGYEDIPLYTSPQPAAQWVRLTQQDIDIAFDDTQEGGGFDDFARAIEAKLREKNGGKA